MSATGYSLSSYGRMITCEPRMGAFALALERSITPGCRVIDLGAGPGLFAILACHYGAGHVVAIEPDPSIEIARKLAGANGCADRITFVRDLSTNWHPDVLADVVISDIRGVMPFFEHHISCLTDVRARLLKPGGIQIPGQDRIFAVLVEAPKEHARYTRPWLDQPYGVDMGLVHPFTINSWGRAYLTAETLLSAPVPFAILDYNSITAPNHSADLTFTTSRPGIAHGILMWFETELVPGVGYSNAPGEPEQVYGQAFFPLEQPVELAEGANAEATVSANLVDGNYIWNWAFSAKEVTGKTLRFRQSSFKSHFPDPAALAGRAANHCPAPSLNARIDSRALALFDGKTDLRRIAAILRQDFPDHFSTDQTSLDHAASLSARYGAKE